MSNFKKIICILSLLFVSTFVSVGYASLSNDLNISGDLIAIPSLKYEIYISDAEVYTSANVTNINYAFDNPTNFTSVVKANRSGGGITYCISVTNDSDKTYWYDGTRFVSSAHNNSLIGNSNGITITTKDKISDSSATFNSDDWIPPHTTRDFYVTYSFGSNTLTYEQLATYINYHFEIRIDGVYDQFVAALNNPDSYRVITDYFDKKYREDKSVSVGNIGKDEVFFDSLFGPDMTVVVDGVEKPVTVLIRRENVDNKATGDDYNVSGGPTGCEYTIYITTDDLSTSGGTATVYAITYSQASDGTWHKLAQLYQGTAPKEDYDSSTSAYEGSIDYTKWNASANVYEIADGISYKAGQPNGDQYDIIKNYEQLMTVQDQNLFNSIDNSRIMKTLYDLIQQTKNSNSAEVIALREAFAYAEPHFINHNNGQEFKIIREGTRAEIISYIRQIQDSLDYYYQLH